MLSNNSSRIVFMLAKQRSGTNMFRKSISDTPGFYNMKEIFHESEDPMDLDNFWNWKLQKIKENGKLIIPSKFNVDYLLDSFFEAALDRVDKKNPGATLLVDVKYNSILHASLLWESPVEIPYLLRYIKAKQYGVIHLVRRNLLASYMSSLVAKETNVWHNFSGTTPVDNVKVNVSLKDMVAKLKMREKEISQFRNRLTRLEVPSIELGYETLATEDGTAFSESACLALSSLLGNRLKTKNIPITTSKVISTPLVETIKNVGAVKQQLVKMGYEDFL